MKPKKIIHIFGNPLLDFDNLPLKLAPKLQKIFPEIDFVITDPSENIEPINEELIIIDTVENIKKVFEEFNAGGPKGHFKYKFLDLLNCDGGCIGGPAINRQDLSIEQRKKIIFEYTHRSSESTMGKHDGKVKDAIEIDLSASF